MAIKSKVALAHSFRQSVATVWCREKEGGRSQALGGCVLWFVFVEEGEKLDFMPVPVYSGAMAVAESISPPRFIGRPFATF